jgi:microcompartment protein CcmK/EutM
VLLCEVLGQVWGARQAPRLAGHRLLVVEPFALGDDGNLRRGQRRLVAVDALGAGPGEMVLVAHGSRCRDLTSGPDVPTKEVVVAIVDSADVGARR